jgi:hypothetical protein
MAITPIGLAVELEDGTTWQVSADQRDLAKWELQPFYDPARLTVRQRYMGYAASVRAGKTELSWTRFDAACIEVRGAGDDEPEEVDPTEPDPSGEA